MNPTPDDGAQAPISDEDRERVVSEARICAERRVPMYAYDPVANLLALDARLTAETAAREKAERERDAAEETRSVWRAEHAVLRGKLDQAMAGIAVHHERETSLTQQKDGAYTERNALVCALSKLFPAWLGLHDMGDASWDAEWRNIVFIHLPTGQVSWHIHDRELSLFTHLKRGDGQWDGHSTEEKYRRLSALAERDAHAADAARLRALVDRAKDVLANTDLPGDCAAHKAYLILLNAALAAKPEAKTRAEHWHERDDEARRNDATTQPKETT